MRAKNIKTDPATQVRKFLHASDVALGLGILFPFVPACLSAYVPLLFPPSNIPRPHRL